MIRNDEDLRIVLKQIGHAEKALASLREDVFPKNPRNFEVLSEGYVDIIDELRALVDAYRASGNRQLPAQADAVNAPESVR